MTTETDILEPQIEDLAKHLMSNKNVFAADIGRITYSTNRDVYFKNLLCALENLVGASQDKFSFESLICFVAEAIKMGLKPNKNRFEILASFAQIRQLRFLEKWRINSFLKRKSFAGVIIKERPFVGEYDVLDQKIAVLEDADKVNPVLLTYSSGLNCLTDEEIDNYIKNGGYGERF